MIEGSLVDLLSERTQVCLTTCSDQLFHPHGGTQHAQDRGHPREVNLRRWASRPDQKTPSLVDAPLSFGGLRDKGHGFMYDPRSERVPVGALVGQAWCGKV